MSKWKTETPLQHVTRNFMMRSFAEAEDEEDTIVSSSFHKKM